MRRPNQACRCTRRGFPSCSWRHWRWVDLYTRSSTQFRADADCPERVHRPRKGCVRTIPVSSRSASLLLPVENGRPNRGIDQDHVTRDRRRGGTSEIRFAVAQACQSPRTPRAHAGPSAPRGPGSRPSFRPAKACACHSSSSSAKSLRAHLQISCTAQYYHHLTPFPVPYRTSIRRGLCNPASTRALPS